MSKSFLAWTTVAVQITYCKGGRLALMFFQPTLTGGQETQISIFHWLWISLFHNELVEKIAALQFEITIFFTKKANSWLMYFITT